MKSIVDIVLAAILSAFALLAMHASAQQYPSRPIRIIVPFAPGAATDTIARLVAHKMTESWGQQVVVDNRGGAGGNIGMGIAANAPADGHTILFVSSSFMVNPGLYKKIPYDPYKSFIPVSNLSASPHIFFAHPSQPVKSLAELIATVKRDPKKYSMATPGIGTVPHLSAHLLAIDAKLDLVTVPYGGGGPSLAAVVGNQVPFGCQAVPPVTPHVQAGRVRALAFTSAKRTANFPDVPTMAELGFKGHESETITGMLMPAGTPPAIVKKLYAETARIIRLPDVSQRILEMGADVIVSSPQQFSAQIKSEVTRWTRVVKEANIPAN
ncbi:MAG: Bug family tripartite tricarboxylate transporter substrate binding protein [Burkholderiales bacterium]